MTPTPDIPRAARDELDERDRVLAELAGAVAHKLKQPLAVAWGYMELLLEDGAMDLDPKTLHYLKEIDESLRLMDQVINRLQDACACQTRVYAGMGNILDLDQPRHSSCS
jgi:signal transduction histidine kinase